MSLLRQPPAILVYSRPPLLLLLPIIPKPYSREETVLAFLDLLLKKERKARNVSVYRVDVEVCHRQGNVSGRVLYSIYFSFFFAMADLCCRVSCADLITFEFIYV